MNVVLVALPAGKRDDDREDDRHNSFVKQHPVDNILVVLGGVELFVHERCKRALFAHHRNPF